MASRKWFLLFAFAVMLFVGSVVELQSITTAEEVKKTTTVEATPDPLNDVLMLTVDRKEHVENRRRDLVNQKAQIDKQLEMLDTYLAALNKEIGQAPSNPAPTSAADSRITWEYKSADYTDENANALGKEGWELINVYPLNVVTAEGMPTQKVMAIYKRPVQPMQEGFQKGMMPWEWGYQLATPTPAAEHDTDSAPDAAVDYTERRDIDSLFDAPAPPGFRR